MKYQLISSQNLSALSSILATLKKEYPNHSTLQTNFYRSLPNNGEKPFAIAWNQQEEIKIIYSLHKEYKFTRGMQPICHTQEIVNKVDGKEIEKFNRWMVDNIQGYKILGLKVKQNEIFKPHQIYMEASNRPSL